MVPRQHFNEELKELHYAVLRMASATEDSIRLAVDALTHHDTEIAQQIVTNDDVLDRMELDILNRCVKLIAMQQPLARDLRIICAALKISTDLERIADYGVDIAKVAMRLKDQNYIKPLVDIPKMAYIANDMIKDALNAYINENTVLAEDICRRDDAIDALYKQTFNELMHIIKEDVDTFYQAMHLLLVARYLERIADHVTNICEWVIYTVTGEKKNLNN